jgi:hypothetical protein
MRRRLAWTGAFILLAGLVAGLIVAFPGPGPRAADKLSPGGTLVKPEVPAAFAPRHQQVLFIAQRFIATAVARNHVEDSWELVCPEMKQGYTKTSWSKGDIPVVPFPVDVGKWHVSYSFKEEIDLQVALFAKPKAKLNPVVFDLTVHPCGKQAGKRWLVSSFIPTPSASGDFGSSVSTATKKGPNKYVPFAIGVNPPSPLPHHASSTWLFLPGGIVGGTILIVLGALGIRSVRGRRAYAAYVRERQMSSSRPS